nr:uncharacterized protein LOC108177226 [Oryctolagus cuniculus]
MLTPWVFLVSLAWVCGDTNVRLTQSHLSFTGKSGRTVQISCKLSGVSLKNVIMHWYQQKEGEPLKRILYGFGKNYKQDMPNSRLEARDNDRGIFYLVINNVIESDEATYYCACWDPTVPQSQNGPVRKLSITPLQRPPHSCNHNGVFNALVHRFMCLEQGGSWDKFRSTPPPSNEEAEAQRRQVAFLMLANHRGGLHICIPESQFRASSCLLVVTVELPLAKLHLFQMGAVTTMSSLPT